MLEIKNYKLVSIDMDSTLIKQECIDEIAKLIGVENKVSEITEQAMSGEIDFETSLRSRVNLLRGTPENRLKDIVPILELSDGAIDLIDFFKTNRLKVALISGGFTFFANHCKTLLNLDFAYANKLEVVSGVLTGQVIGDIITANKKAEIVRQLCVDHGIKLSEVISIGDGANDIPMLKQAGLSFAFNAKEITKANAMFSVNHSLSNIKSKFSQP
jgi:phosphoserine phosphatase